VSYAVAARDGVAWVGTMEGTIVPVDIEGRKANRPYKFGAGPGEVDLALSRSGQHMGVIAQDQREKTEPYPTSVRVFRVRGSQLAQTAKGYFRTEDPMTDIEILERAGLVVYTAGGTLFGWYFREKP
jgi:hypothetical protein